MQADINTIARICGVSKATVSRVFTGKAAVSEEVRKLVLEKARDLNYTPQQVAARDSIALITGSPDVHRHSGGFRSLLMADLILEVTKSGYLVNIIEAKDIDRLVTPYTKAAVLLQNEAELQASKEKVASLRLPVISVGNFMEGCLSISSDYIAEMEMAVKHLVANGHKRIALVNDNDAIWAGRERERGYLEALQKHNLTPLHPYNYHVDDHSLMELLATMMQDKPDAVILCGEMIACEAAYSLNLLGIKVPEQLSVISFERYGVSRFFNPPHTTIDQNISMIIEETLSMLKSVIGMEAGRTFVRTVRPELIIRKSVKKMSL